MDIPTNCKNVLILKAGQNQYCYSEKKTILSKSLNYSALFAGRLLLGKMRNTCENVSNVLSCVQILQLC